jgi:heme A synthase
VTRARRVAALAVAALFLVLALGGPVWSQTPSPSGGVSPPDCQAGELCIPQSPAATSGGGQVLVGHDPPAHFVRSLVTMSAIALVLGAYLLMAVMGKRLPLPRRRAEGRR